jgi:hypothetical protein
MMWLLPFIFTTQPAASQPRISPGSGGYAAEENYVGDYIVEGTEVHTIENKLLRITGNLIVRDSAKLVVRNSHIILNVTTFCSYWAKVQDDATFEVENSVLDRASETNVNLSVGDGATLTMDNTTSYWDIPADGGTVRVDSSQIIGSNGIYWKGYAPTQLTLENSSVKILMMSFRGEQEQISLPRLEPGTLDNLLVTTSEGASLDLKNSSVQEWVLELWDDPCREDPNNEKHLIVENSELSGLWIWIHPDAYMKVSNLVLPESFDNWNLRSNFETSGLGYDITLINTTLGGGSVANLKLLTVGKLEVQDVVGCQIAPWGSAEISVENSRIEYGFIMRGNENYVRISNTTITGCTIYFIEGWLHIPEPIGGDNHTVEFSNTKIESDVNWEVSCNQAEIKGEVTILTPMDQVTWDHGTIIREYPLVAKDEAGNPISNATIELFDPQSNLVWSGLTDNEGKVFLSMMFTNENYADEWEIKASIEGTNVSRKLGFLTSTPVILSLPEQPSPGTPTELILGAAATIALVLVIVFVKRMR